jgi:hypothetical protein
VGEGEGRGGLLELALGVPVPVAAAAVTVTCSAEYDAKAATPMARSVSDAPGAAPAGAVQAAEAMDLPLLLVCVTAEVPAAQSKRVCAAASPGTAATAPVPDVAYRRKPLMDDAAVRSCR